MACDQLLESVKDQASFLAFVRALRDDFLTDVAQAGTQGVDAFGRGPKGWENRTIDAFLDGAMSWAEDSNFGEAQTSNENPWQTFATFLYCGKIYE